MSISKLFKSEHDKTQRVTMTLDEYLELCKDDPLAYASASERMLHAIGEPEHIDTSTNPRLRQIFSNRLIKIYPAFKDFYGMEDTISDIVSYFKHSSQGLEEKKQILYLLGPVGGGKSSLAEKLKSLMEVNPIYVLADENGDICPNFESPLSLFPKDTWAKTLETDYNIPSRYLGLVTGPWVLKRLEEYNHDVSKFKVVKLYPNILNEVGISKTEPGDENNQDISALVGKLDIRKLRDFSQNDADAYAFSGGLCRANQGLLEFVEMFKAPIKVLHPLLTATQEGNYKGTEQIPAIPFNGTVLAHSNESEWLNFKNNKNNEAFLDRVYIVKVPYCLRVDEEIKIYQKLIDHSSLKSMPCASHTLEMLAKYAVASRLKEPETSSLHSKLRIYNGENLKDIDPKANSLLNYKEMAGMDEGMDGISTRHAFKLISKVFNHDVSEIAANPVHLMNLIYQNIEKEQYDEKTKTRYQDFLKSVLEAEYKKQLGEEIQECYIESYGEYGQNVFERYVVYADFWMQDQEYRDDATGTIMSREELNKELESIEKPAGIANPKEFRHEIVNYVLRHKAEHSGKQPRWDSSNKMKKVIKEKIAAQTENLLPVISFEKKSSDDEENKHTEFVTRMCDKGYTEKQVRLLSEWYIRVNKSS
jgi:serine protein kinase